MVIERDAPHSVFMPSAIQLQGPIVDDHTQLRAAAQPLRNTLRLNASSSLLVGLAALFAAGRLDAVLGTVAVGWVRLTGAGLTAFGLGVALLAGCSIRHLTRYTPAVIVADATWVAASVATIAAGWYSTTGTIIIGIATAAVATFAARQRITLRALRHAAAGATAPRTPPR